MSSKPPDSQQLTPKIGRFPIPPSQKRFEIESRKATIEGNITELCIAYQIGEDSSSEKRLAMLVASIPPERVDGLIPGMGVTVRRLLQQILRDSRYLLVKQAVSKLLEASAHFESQSGIIVDFAPPLCEEILDRPLHPHFSRPPLRIQALELLREHLEGNGKSEIKEVDLRNAIEVLKFDKDNEAASMIANIACSSPHESVREKARDVLLNFY